MQVNKKYFMEKIELQKKETPLVEKSVELKKGFSKKISQKKEKPKKSVLLKKEEVVAEKDMVEKIEKKVAIEEIVGQRNMPQKGINWLRIVIVALIVVILVLSGMIFYFYPQCQYKKAVAIQAVSETASSEERKAQKEVQEIKETVSQFMELPEDEDPILATVTDIEKIKTQPFFANGQNGDKVLIYANNKKAILYRPATKKIIEVSVVSGLGNNIVSSEQVAEVQSGNANQSLNKGVDASADTPSENNQASVEVAVDVAVYNGGNIKGLAKKIGDKVALISGVIVSEKTNAKGNYEKNLVIDLSNNWGELAQKIAEAIGGEVGALPEGEKKPEADILIIASKE